VDELRIDDEVLDAWPERSAELARNEEGETDGSGRTETMRVLRAAIEAAAAVSRKHRIDAMTPIVDAINGCGAGLRLEAMSVTAGDSKEADRCPR
jgi:hypothetical protein